MSHFSSRKIPQRCFGICLLFSLLSLLLLTLCSTVSQQQTTQPQDPPHRSKQTTSSYSSDTLLSSNPPTSLRASPPPPPRQSLLPEAPLLQAEGYSATTVVSPPVSAANDSAEKAKPKSSSSSPSGSSTSSPSSSSSSSSSPSSPSSSSSSSSSSSFSDASSGHSASWYVAVAASSLILTAVVGSLVWSLLDEQRNRGRAAEFFKEAQVSCGYPIPRSEIEAYDRCKAALWDKLSCLPQCRPVQSSSGELQLLTEKSSEESEVSKDKTNKHSFSTDSKKSPEERSACFPNDDDDDDDGHVCEESAEDDWLRSVDQDDKKQLKALLLKRTIGNIPRWEAITRDIEGKYKLYKRRIISEHHWRTVDEAHTELCAEIEYIKYQAECLEVGWGDKILKNAWVLHSHQRDKQQEQTRKVENEQMRAKQLKQQQRLQEHQQRLEEQRVAKQERMAEKAAQRLIQEEEATAVRRRIKAKDS